MLRVEIGPGDLFGGTFREFRRKVNTRAEHEPSVSANWGVEHAADRAFHVNARYAPNSFDLRQTNRVTPAVGPRRDDRLFQRYRTPGYGKRGLKAAFPVLP